MRSNAFAKSLMDKEMNSFWRGIRKVNNAKISLESTVENCVDEQSINFVICGKLTMNLY